MRQSQMFIPTLREIPATAEAVSHKLLLKSGMIKQVSAGIYTYLPLSTRVLEKIKNIIREEHEKVGAAELIMPILQGQEYWEETGRWNKMGAELMRITDRKGAGYALSPTAEEIVVQTVKNNLNSYKQLPIILYQIQTKFRDEMRPRFGLLRGKEFIMKDAYSFHSSEESLNKTYMDMYKIYEQIFDRCGLQYRAVKADSGNIGGDNTYEFQALAEIGEDTIVYTNESDYAANIEMAGVTEKNYVMSQEEEKEQETIITPEIKTIEELSAYLCIEKDKTLKVIGIKNLENDEKIIILLRGDHTLNEVKVKKHLNISEYEMLTEEEVLEIGAVPGYIGPFGLKNVKTFADNAIKYMKNFVMGANQTDKHIINSNIKDIEIDGYYDLRNIVEGEIVEDLSGKAIFAKGIEVGQVFKLGKIYSEAMEAKYLDQNGKAIPYLMGCYGIGVSRLLSAIVEQHSDENGIVWPKEVSPFDIHLICVDVKKEEQKQMADKIYNQLREKDVQVLYDERAERAGVKFNDADLIGIPYQIIVGKNATNGVVEIKERKMLQKEEIREEEVVNKIIEVIK